MKASDDKLVFVAGFTPYVLGMAVDLADRVGRSPYLLKARRDIIIIYIKYNITLMLTYIRNYNYLRSRRLCIGFQKNKIAVTGHSGPEAVEQWQDWLPFWGCYSWSTYFLNVGRHVYMCVL